MIDHAPALEGQEDHGNFFRVVVNISTIPETVERLIRATIATGQRIILNSRSNGTENVAEV